MKWEEVAIHSSSNPLFPNIVERNKASQKFKIENIISFIKDPINLILLIFLIFTYFICNFCGVYFFYKAAFENPWSLQKALPDVISNFWPSFSLSRSLQNEFSLFSQSLSSKLTVCILISIILSHLSNFVSFVLLIFSIYYTIVYRNTSNIRKLIIIIIISLIFKSLFSVFTQLPPSCSGSSYCKCSDFIDKIKAIYLDPENNCVSKNPKFKNGTKLFYIKNNETEMGKNKNMNFNHHQINDDRLKICENGGINILSLFTVSLVYSISFSLKISDNIPFCGSSMMSGQAIIQICLGIYIIDLLKDSGSKSKSKAMIIIVLISISFLNSILYRDEYTLSRVIPIVFIIIIHDIYCYSLLLLDSHYYPFMMTRFGLFLSWIEERNDISTSQFLQNETEEE